MITHRRFSWPRVPVLLLGCLLTVAAGASTLRKPAHATLSTRACEAATVDADDAYCDSSLPMEDRVADLLARLTVEEKIALLVNSASAVPSQSLPAYEWWSEALHGVGGSPGVTFAPPTPSATSFPQVITTSHSFNPTLMQAIGSAISTEGRVFNNVGHAGNTFWAPNINIFRDPRWGRGQETPGEDPFLSSVYATAFVRGMQEGEDGRYLKTSACCKHFAAYSVENLYNGTHRHNFDAQVTKQDMVDTYLPAFEACVVKGKASALMCSYNSINGVPACADAGLLNGMAREEWRFDGYVTSDCGAISDIWKRHNYTDSPEGACQVALQAGCDLDCSTFYAEHCPAALAQGLIQEGDLDRALGHLLRVQFRLGLFDSLEEQVYTKYGLEKVNSEEHQMLALEAARQGMVLLKNDHGVLPLSLSVEVEGEWGMEEDGMEEGAVLKTAFLRRERERQLRRGHREEISPPLSLAVIGPHANATEALLGNYQGVPPFIISPFEGLRKYVSDAVLVEGCGINSTLTEDQMNAADAAARAADVTILVLGLDSSIEGEGLDRTSILLPAPQVELAARVLGAAATGEKKVVVVLIAGGAVDVEFLKEDGRVAAMVFAGYPGQAGGQALAEILFGDINPSGRLTQTFYPAEFVSQAGAGDMRMRPHPTSGFPGRTYRFYEGSVVFPFGYGLSYSSFEMQEVACPAIDRGGDDEVGDGNSNSNRSSSDSSSSSSSSGSIVGAKKLVHLTTHSLEESEGKEVGRVCVEVINKGPRAGRIALLGFLSPPESEGAPRRSLRAFGGVDLAPQEAAVAMMTFIEADVSLADAAGVFERVPGQWVLEIEDIRVVVPVM